MKKIIEFIKKLDSIFNEMAYRIHKSFTDKMKLKNYSYSLLSQKLFKSYLITILLLLLIVIESVILILSLTNTI